MPPRAPTDAARRNQATRIVYRDYDSSNAWPGSLAVNMFFVLSLLCGVFAGVLQWREESRLRAAEPDTYPPGPIDLLREKLEEAREMRLAALQGARTPVWESSPPPPPPPPRAIL